jgi:adenine-specific DNA-methyltransferase
MQTTLDLPVQLPKDAYDYGERASGETHGVVLTKPHIVELILDLSGYTTDRDLCQLTLLEPSCGHGAFLVPALRRLLSVAKRQGRAPDSLDQAILAYDIDAGYVEKTKLALLAVLHEHGVQSDSARHLVDTWVRTGDFLLTSFSGRVDVVVGNPPYIRIEQLSESLQAEYRRRYQSLYDRADIYVAFIERGLSLLAEHGVLSFICADRWVANKYGAPLRAFVTSRFKVRCYIDLHTASPFESEVVAYPSIFALCPGTNGSVPVVTLETGSQEEAESVVPAIRGDGGPLPTGVTVQTYDSWFSGDEPWVLSSPRHLKLLRELEGRLEPITASARVGIGVATGNDRVYIVPAHSDVERDRLVPLVMRGDIENGRVKDSGRFVINTFGPDGRVVDLQQYPRLRRYLDEHADGIRKRHVSQKNPGSWFRTIDRVYPELVAVPKLLIPDIAGSNEVVFEAGQFHPHHNLYFVTSSHWDMEVLGGLLSSRVALFFVWSYAVKMRGGYLRFQAQYLRRIRLPQPQSIPLALMDLIKAAFRSRDFPTLDTLALEAYGLTELPPFDFVDTRR